MSIKRVVFIVEQTFSRRDYERYGLHILEGRGLGVEIWDVTPWLHPELRRGKPAAESFPAGGCQWIPDRGRFEELASGLGTDVFAVCLVGYIFAAYPIYRALSHANVPYAVHVGGLIPSVAETQSALRYYLKRGLEYTPQHLVNAIFARLPFKRLGVKPARFILASGTPPRHWYPMDKSTETVRLHSSDYDLFLASRSRGLEADPCLGVFIDQSLADHPDSIAAGEKHPVTAGRYYAALRRFFGKLEERPGVRIIVAAHPRSNYSSDAFGPGREVVKGGTSDLVARAGFVIVHYSTAVSFAVLSRKPVIFTTTDELSANYQGPLVDHLALLLGKRALNVDALGDFDWKTEMRVDEEAYRAYAEKYLKPCDSPEMPSWELVADKLSSI